MNSPHVAQATQIDVLVGSAANDLNSSGAFCAGSQNRLDHQRINCTLFVFSTAVPALLAVSATRSRRNTPSILSALQENERATRVVLDCIKAITTPSHAASSTIRIHLRSAAPLSSATLKA
jgi:serine palmitoyltransferase